MKKLFRNRYFSFLMIYLCILSIVSMSFSFSRYKSENAKINDTHAAIYDVAIYSGDLQSTNQTITMSVYATSKISETGSMIDGTYEKKQVNIHNFSECDISISNMKIGNQAGSLYEKLIFPMDKDEMTEYETQYGSIPLAILNYIGKTETELVSADDVRIAVNAKNDESFKIIEENGIIKSGESKTFFIISWVEHDDVYKADADQNDDKISHKTLSELGLESEEFVIQATSNQVD